MGLDIVELFIGVEDAFHVSIEDADAANLRTAAQLTDYLVARLAGSPDPACLGQRAFYRVRAVLQAEIGAPRNTIRPESALEHLVPPHARRRVWAELERSLGNRRWPALHPPSWLAIGYLVVGGLVFSGVASVVQRSISRYVVALLAAIGFFTVLLPFTRGFHCAFPRKIITVGDLARYVATNSPSALKPRTAGWTHDQVLATVRELVRHHLGITDFRDDDDFVRDLGAG